MNAPHKPSTGQTISRAFSVLQVVAEHPGSSLGQIAQKLGFARSTVQGIINALQAEGAVARNSGRQGLFLGIKILRLASRVDIDIRTVFRPLIEELSEMLGENVNLTILRHGQVIVIDQMATYEEIRIVAYVGSNMPLHCSATGKAHLSRLSDQEVLNLLGHDLLAMTPKTQTDPAKIISEVRAVSDEPLFYDREEMIEGVCAVATMLPEVNHTKLAVAVSMPTSRFACKLEEVEAAILQIRKEAFQKFSLNN